MSGEITIVKMEPLKYPNANFCELCFTNALYFGEIFPHHDLIFHDGFYKIVNVHDEIIRFHAPPIVDPCEGLSEDAVDSFCNNPANDKVNEDFFKYFEAFRENFRFHPDLGEEIMILCRQVGFNKEKHGWLEYWLVPHAAKMIAAKK